MKSLHNDDDDYELNFAAVAMCWDVVVESVVIEKFFELNQ
jgi:hypothetical protein